MTDITRNHDDAGEANLNVTQTDNMAEEDDEEATGTVLGRDVESADCPNAGNECPPTEEEDSHSPELQDENLDEFIQTLRHHQVSRIEPNPTMSTTESTYEDPNSSPAIQNFDEIFRTVQDQQTALAHDTNHVLQVQLRINDFERARFLRRETYLTRPFGIYGLFQHLADLRLDLEWASDAAWRRLHGKPYLSWIDFDRMYNQNLVYRKVPYFTYLLVMVSTIMMIVSFWLNEWKFAPTNINPMFGPSAETLLRLGALESSRIVEDNEYYRLVAPIVLHAGIIHLVINVLAMFFIGGAVERIHGTALTGFVFLVSAIGGNIISALFTPNAISVGASGGIFAILGLALSDACANWKLIRIDDALQKRRRNNQDSTPLNDAQAHTAHQSNVSAVHCFPYKLVCLSVTLDILVNIIIGLTPFVDNFAHMGGFFYGFCFTFPALTHHSQAKFFGKISTNRKAELETHDNQNRSKDKQGSSHELAHRRRSQNCCGAVFRLLVFVASIFVFFTTLGVLIMADSSPVTVCKRCRYISCLPFPFWVENDQRWWHCDPCNIVEGQLYNQTTKPEIELVCPYGDVAIIDLAGENLDTEVLNKKLPDYCRNFCDI